MRITVAQIHPRLGDIASNLIQIETAIQQAVQETADLIVFPEMALTGYPLRDMLDFPDMAKHISLDIDTLLGLSKKYPIPILIGTPLGIPEGNTIHRTNAAIGLYNGDMAYVRHKALLPNYDIFDESRYFHAPQFHASIWPLKKRIGVLICEEAWTGIESTRYDRDPVKETVALGSEALVVMMASPYEKEKPEQRYIHFEKLSHTYNIPIVMVNQVAAIDDLIFDGHSLIITPKKIWQFPGFKAHTATHDITPYQGEGRPRGERPLETFFSGAMPPTPPGVADTLKNIYEALSFSLKEYVRQTGLKKVILGLSGGIDSALTAAIACDALGPDAITGVAMPSRYSSPDSLHDAQLLANTLGITFMTYPIDPLHHLFEETLPDILEGLAGENVQPRIRATLLMALANHYNALLLSTGNKSEIAMGYCTMYGDMCGGICPLGDVYKTEVYALAKYRNSISPVIPQHTIDRPPSAELRPNQTDQDSLPPYAYMDSVIADYLENRQSLDTLTKKHGDPALTIIKQLHANEYKRRQAALIPRIRKSAFGTGYRMPIVGMMPQC